jgi:hypothetical protein
VDLDLEAIAAWQFDQLNQLIIQGIVEGRDMSSPEEVKRITDIVVEMTKNEYGF